MSNNFNYLLFSFDLDTTTWSVVKPSSESDIPSGRLFHTAAVIGDQMYIYGGTVDNNVRSSELFRFQFSCYPKCTLRDDFGRLLESKQFCDVEFVVGGDVNHETGSANNMQIIDAHIAFVIARSQYLRSKVRKAIEEANDLKECNVDEDEYIDVSVNNKRSAENKSKLRIVLNNVNPEAFELVLNYIYTDHIDPYKRSDDPLSNKIVLLMMDVYTLAVRFQMKRLEQLCVQYLNAAITHKNVLVALQNAHQMKLDFIKVKFCLFKGFLLVLI